MEMDRCHRQSRKISQDSGRSPEPGPSWSQQVATSLNPRECSWNLSQEIDWHRDIALYRNLWAWKIEQTSGFKKILHHGLKRACLILVKIKINLEGLRIPKVLVHFKQ